ncbi:MAG TPA: type III pantothenate kinase [Gammaproteobacteria bacterium]|nr:type III pantothenate kinase [Gammaproteobacteria bacterium]
MFLLLDVGNSAVKWAVSDKGRIQHMTSRLYTKEALGEVLSGEVNIKEYSPNAVIVSNVAGDAAQQAVIHWCEETFHLRPVFPCVAKFACGLENAYNPPCKLGVDRWLALIAAKHAYSKPICVVDCGTAVTIDAIDTKSQFIGGVIMPGLHIMRYSLQSRTNALFLTSESHTASEFSQSTDQCVLSGTTLAITALIEKMVLKLEKKTGERVFCVLTGGDAKKILPALTISVAHVDNLVLQGLILWGRENGLVV